MNAVTTAPTRASMKPLAEVASIGEALSHPDMLARLKAAVPRHLSADRMLRVLVLAVQKTPELAKCDVRTLMGAMLVSSSLGLEPNTPLQHSYLIPFKSRRKVGPDKWEDGPVSVNLIIGYRGFIDLARRTGSLTSIHADVVYEGDEFSFEYGSNQHLRHVPRATADDAKRRPLWCYAHVKLRDGEAFEVLPYNRVLTIRNSSQGYQAALTARQRYGATAGAYAKAPWIAFEHEMACKTLIRRLAKVLPMSAEFAVARALDEAADAHAAVAFGAVVDASATEIVDTAGASIPEPEPEGQPAPAPEPEPAVRLAPAPGPNRPAPAATPAAAQTAPAAQRVVPTTAAAAKAQPAQQAQPAATGAPPTALVVVDEVGETCGSADTDAQWLRAVKVVADEAPNMDSMRAVWINNRDTAVALGITDDYDALADLGDDPPALPGRVPADEPQAAAEGATQPAAAPPAEAQPANPLKIEPPRSDKGRFDPHAYVKQWSERLAACATPAEVDALANANAAILGAVPAASRMQVTRIIEQRKGALRE